MNLFIELCNYKDYPLGGHLSFAKHLTHAMSGDLDLIGISTEDKDPIQQWYKKEIEGNIYSVFNIYRCKKSSKKPFIPTRISDYLALKKCINKIDFQKYNNIIVQTPEVLMNIPNKYLNKVVLIMPGVENPLSISRYKIARNFQKTYDYFFFKKAHKVHIILAAADKKSISKYIERSKGKVKQDQVIQFPTRYDETIFHQKDIIVLRTKYQISLEQKVIITTGRLNWFKGWKFMIDSFILFQNEYPNSTLLFIGSGEDQEKLQAYINENKQQENIKLLGYQSLSTISDYLNLADLFIMGSYKEGWSTSLVEAVACGKPCVVTDFSSADEMVFDNKNGFVVKERNENLFAKKMVKALTLSKETIQQTTNQITNFSVGNMNKAFTKHLQ